MYIYIYMNYLRKYISYPAGSFFINCCYATQMYKLNMNVFGYLVCSFTTVAKESW